MRYHQHDVHDVNVAVFVEVIVIIITPVLSAPAMPATSNKHDVLNIHLAIGVDVTNTGRAGGRWGVGWCVGRR